MARLRAAAPLWGLLALVCLAFGVRASDAPDLANDRKSAVSWIQATQASRNPSEIIDSPVYTGSWQISRTAPKIARRLGLLGDDETDPCGANVQIKYNCTDHGCEDLVPGYINYIYFYECTAADTGSKFGTFVMFIVWMLFLLHLVEGTTNDYFCTSLQLAVAILELTPNVAGVTFLAVGNAACDVIASIAAFATGVPKVGVGTTVGAGIFVTCAVVAAVTFVADVRLARRSFVRDIMFFIITVLYLLLTTIDGIITLAESIGFVVIYIVFVVAVAGGRWLRFLRHKGEDDNEEDRAGMSVAGASPDEAGVGPRKGSIGGPSDRAQLVAAPGGGYQAPGGVASVRGAEMEAGSAAFAAGSPLSLNVFEQARRSALNNSAQRDGGRATRYLADNGPADDDDDDEDEDPFAVIGGPKGEDDDDGDLGSGSSDIAGLSRYGGGGGRTGSFVEDLGPSKPSKWTRTFLATQNDRGAAFTPFQMPKYHKRRLLNKLLRRLTAHGNTVLVLGDGTSLDLAELAVTDPDAAMNIAAAMAASVTAAASKSGGKLSYAAAAAAIKSAAAASGHAGGHHGHGDSTATGGGSSTGMSSSSSGSSSGSVPVRDVLAVLPHETVKPTANLYRKAMRVVGIVGPYWHTFMVACELPVTLLRHLTIPLLHEGSYRRRLALLNMPCCLAFGAEIFATHILKGSPTDVGGFPIFLLCFIAGIPLAMGMNMLLPSHGTGFMGKLAYGGNGAEAGHRAPPSGGESSGLLAAGSATAKDGSTALLSADGGSSSSSSSSSSSNSGADHSSGGGQAHGHHKKKWWIKQLGHKLAGPNSEPPPTGAVFTCYLVLSFVMALFWLLIVASEIVGTAVCFGKVLSVPDVVMGLTVLAIGNSINDLAASLTIAREGYPTMAVAGAYAGPMFNVLAGIGLPMLIYTLKDPSHQYNIGKDTPLVWASFIALLTSLTVTLIWVPFEGWRLTRRIGKFLLFWFFGFVVMVVFVAATGLSPEDSGYWAIRGLAQPARLLLRYLDVEFSDVTYEQTPAPECSRDAWLSVKPTLQRNGLDFPNLPYLIDSTTGVNLSQSQSILRYIGRAYGGQGGVYDGTPAHLAEIDQLLDTVIDIRQPFTRFCYGGGDAKALFTQTLAGGLESIDAYIKKRGTKFAVSDELSIADFSLFEVLAGLDTCSTELLGASVLEAYPALSAFYAAFKAEPKIAAIIASAQWMQRPYPYNNTQAQWR